MTTCEAVAGAAVVAAGLIFSRWLQDWLRCRKFYVNDASVTVATVAILIVAVACMGVWVALATRLGGISLGDMHVTQYSFHEAVWPWMIVSTGVFLVIAWLRFSEKGKQLPGVGKVRFRHDGHARYSLHLPAQGFLLHWLRSLVRALIPAKCQCKFFQPVGASWKRRLALLNGLGDVIIERIGSMRSDEVLVVASPWFVGKNGLPKARRDALIKHIQRAFPGTVDVAQIQPRKMPLLVALLARIAAPELEQSFRCGMKEAGVIVTKK